MFLPDRLVETRDLIGALHRYTAGIPRPASGFYKSVRQNPKNYFYLFILRIYF